MRFRLSVKALAAATLLVFCGGLQAGAAPPGAGHDSQRFLRSDARTLRRLQRRLRQVLEEEDRPRRDGPAVERRLGKTGARRHRRAAGRRRDARRSPTTSTRSPTRRSCCPRTGRRACRITARRIRRRSSFSCARAIRSTSATGTTWSKPGIAVITPNPKTSGGARWNFLAAWAYALEQHGGSAASAKALRHQALQERPGARFRRARLDDDVRRARHRRRRDRVGERRVARGQQARASGRFEIVRPSLSILAEPPVALVDAVVAKKGTRAVAQAYLEFLYSPHGPRDHRAPLLPPARSRRSRNDTRTQFPAMKLVDIDRFGGWRKAQQDVLRRRRRLRPDLPAESDSARCRRNRGCRQRSIIPGFGLTLGFTIFYLSLIVLIPLSATFVKTSKIGLARSSGTS